MGTQLLLSIELESVVGDVRVSGSLLPVHLRLLGLIHNLLGLLEVVAMLLGVLNDLGKLLRRL